jgi:hypothetical protein
MTAPMVGQRPGAATCDVVFVTVSRQRVSANRYDFIPERQRCIDEPFPHRQRERPHRKELVATRPTSIDHDRSVMQSCLRESTWNEDIGVEI